MVKGFPFEVPADYKNLPQLKGRAEIEMKIKLKEMGPDGATGGIFKVGYGTPHVDPILAVIGTSPPGPTAVVERSRWLNRGRGSDAD